MNVKKRGYSAVLILLVPFLFSLFMFSSCSTYPTIPRIEGAEQGKNETATPQTRSIGQIFQEKAPTLISPPEKKEKEYQIGSEDVLQIMVWDHDDLNREVYISREGEFSYPLIGSVHADGLTIGQLEEEIKTRLAGRYIVNPQVTVTVKEYKSKRIFLLGEAGGTEGRGKGPGAYPLTGKTTLVEILSLAGGLTKDSGTEVTVIRPKNAHGSPVPLEKAGKEDEVIKINLRKLLEGDTSQNIYLEPNDTIYVSKAEYFYVYGEVNSPGRYTLEKGTTVLKAITTAGGVTEKAAVNKTKVVREREGAKAEMPVKMTDPVEPEDIVMVPESFF